ncbi:hypothetical protein VB636_06960 [Paracoccus sp. APAP_BH8]|uniref:hypothetical protein n=1 Tax=Paracoccus sp. APAP_BH8 TaxID=3110237 RepID=UPI002FD7AB52
MTDPIGTAIFDMPDMPHVKGINTGHQKLKNLIVLWDNNDIIAFHAIKPRFGHGQRACSS